MATAVIRSTKLLNLRNDAGTVAEQLRQAGFNVTLKLDASELQDAIRAYGGSAGRATRIRRVHYAGHGVQLNWRNFLLPVDAKIRSRADIQPEAVDLGILLDVLGRAQSIRSI